MKRLFPLALALAACAPPTAPFATCSVSGSGSLTKIAK